MDPCFVAPELLLWPVAKPSLSLQAPNLQAQLLERRGARPARSYTSTTDVNLTWPSVAGRYFAPRRGP